MIPFVGMGDAHVALSWFVDPGNGLTDTFNGCDGTETKFQSFHEPKCMTCVAELISSMQYEFLHSLAFVIQIVFLKCSWIDH